MDNDTELHDTATTAIFGKLEGMLAQLCSDSKSTSTLQLVRSIRTDLAKNSQHRDLEIKLIISSGGLRTLVAILADTSSSTSLLRETLHLLSTLAKWQNRSFVPKVLVVYNCIPALLDIIQRTCHDSLASDVKMLLSQLKGDPFTKTKSNRNLENTKTKPKKNVEANEKAQEMLLSISQQNNLLDNPKSISPKDIHTFQTLCDCLMRSSDPKVVSVELDGLRTILRRLPTDSLFYPNVIDAKAVRVLTFVMWRYSDVVNVRSEAKHILMFLIPNLRPNSTCSMGMVRVPFAPLLQRENEALVLDALELLHKYAQQGKTHIDALLDPQILSTVLQWQFEKLSSDRRLKCWCGKVRKLMSEIIWEISARGSSRQVCTLIEENPIAMRAFVSILIDSQVEPLTSDNSYALEKALDAFVNVLKKLPQGRNQSQLGPFISLVEATGAENCLRQCKDNPHLERHQEAILKALRFLKKMM